MAKASVFASRMDSLAVRIEKKTTQKVNKLALAIQRDLVMTTPVDTGQAISNWVLTLNHPAHEFIPPYSPGNTGSTRQLNIGAAYTQAMFAVADRKPGQDIWISNWAPYIMELNRGGSRQAPAGFIENAIIRGIRSVRGVRIL